MVRPLLAWAALGMTALMVRADIVPVVFELDPAVSNLEVGIAVFGASDTDSTPLAGTLEANLQVDTSGVSPVVQSIEFTGGTVSATSALLYSLSVIVIFPFTVNVDIGNVAGFPATPDPPSPVVSTSPDNLNYDVDASAHALTLNQGNVVVSGAFNTSIDLSQTPVTGTAPEGTLGTLSLSPAGGNQFDAILELPINISATFDIVAAVEATINVTGVGVSTASFSLGETGQPADFDGDGDVDGDDFLTWQANFGTTTGADRENGDADNDEDVDGDDFLAWQAAFGTGVNAASAVPEPTTLWLGLLTITVVVTRRSGGRSA